MARQDASVEPTLGPAAESGLDDPDLVPTIVGVGASAGGLQPLQQLFEHCSLGDGLAWVVVQHLSPDFESYMEKLLPRHTGLHVERVGETTRVAPETIYLIPPGKNMVLERGRLRLIDQDRSPGHALNFPIDVFFRSLAEDMQERAIAVILSGTGTDGTRGAQAVRDAGGVVLVQDPETAQFDGMPRSVLSGKFEDHILAPPEIARAVRRHLRACDLESGSAGADASWLSEVLEVLRSGEGIDFSQYRESTLTRRIERRISISRSPGPDAYLEMLRESAPERSQLRDDLLIQVTGFFRDGPAWAALDRLVLKPLVARARSDGELRLWVSACSTGEEVYTLAMLLREGLDACREPVDVKIFGTDVDPNALERAAAGRYMESALADVTPGRMSRFFEPAGGNHLRVSPRLREMVMFSEHNLTRDAPFTRMDVVTCRNTLIYMLPKLQARVLSSLHFALKKNGVLFLGSSESVGALERDFEDVDRKWKIFRKSTDRRLTLEHLRFGRVDRITMPRQAVGSAHRMTTEMSDALEALATAHESACLVVDPAGVLLHVFGGADEFFRPPRGRVQHDVGGLLKPEIAMPVGIAIQRAFRERKPVRYGRVRLDGDPPRIVDVHVVPAPEKETRITFALVELKLCQHVAAQELPRFEPGEAARARIRDLENELEETRATLQDTVEELSTTNEEQQATNEELLASNEELQSTNEELQSVNEELYTVNAEYQNKIQELTVLNSDMDNLLRSTEIGTVFLDRDFRVRKFTPAAAEAIHLMDHDVGRPITHLAHRLDIRDLEKDLTRALEEKIIIQRDCASEHARNYYLTILPYLARPDVVEGLVLTLVDTTEMRRKDRELRDGHERLQLAIGAARIGTWDWNARDDVLVSNDRFLEMFGIEPQSFDGQLDSLLRRVHENDSERVRTAIMGNATPVGPAGSRFRTRGHRGQVRFLDLRWIAASGAGGAPERVSGVCIDVTDRELAERELRERVEERTREVGEALRRETDLQLALRMGDVGVWSWALETDRVSWDGYLCDMFGVPRGSELTKAEFLQQVHTEDRDHVEEGLRAAVEEDAPMETGYRIVRPDGTERAVFSKGRIHRDASGKPVALNAVSIDLTESLDAKFELDRARREAAQSHERYWRLFETGGASLLEVDYSAVRAELERISQEGDLEEILNGDPDLVRSLIGKAALKHASRACLELFDTEAAPDLDFIFRPVVLEEPIDLLTQRLLAIARGDCVFSADARVATMSGRPIDILTHVYFPPPGVSYESIPVTVIDTTVLKTKEHKLRETLCELERSNAELERFAYVASHDLQEPLRKLISFSQLLEADTGEDLNEKARRDLTFIMDAATRMRTLIRALLELGRAGRTELNREVFPLERAVRRSEESLSARIEESGGRLHVGDLPEVSGDESLLGLVFQNLLGNAFKFMPPDRKPEVHVEAEIAQGMLEVTVRDNGIGMASEHFQEIFEPFKRLHARTHYEGSGIGLSICKRIVERHGGGIRVASTPGKGSSFTVSLPNTR